MIGLADDAGLFKSEVWPSQHNQTEELLEKIDTLLAQASKSRQDLSGILAVVGPGSYTGLRVGLSTANALSFAWQLPIAGLHSDESESQKSFVAAVARFSAQPLKVYYERPPHITSPKSR